VLAELLTRTCKGFLLFAELYVEPIVTGIHPRKRCVNSDLPGGNLLSPSLA
jgi:hypothetical protein